MKTLKHSFKRNSQSSSSVGRNEALGQSEEFLEFQECLSRVAPINRPVLLLGERGTGKELFAQLYRAVTPRKGEQRTVNCAEFAGELLRGEVFVWQRVYDVTLGQTVEEVPYRPGLGAAGIGICESTRHYTIQSSALSF